MDKEQQIQEFKKETGFDEIVIGCFFSNYMVSHICPIATGGWCRDYVKCKCMQESIERKIKEQQAHNVELARKDKENRLKGVILSVILGFIGIMDLTMIALIVWLLMGM